MKNQEKMTTKKEFMEYYNFRISKEMVQLMGSAPSPEKLCITLGLRLQDFE